MRERYTRNMELYFATEHPLRFSTEVWGLRRDGSEFVGEMSWGIVETIAGPLLLAIGRDISERRAAEARLRAVAAMGERALAGADPADLAAEAVELMRTTLPIAGAEVRLADGAALASDGPTTEAACGCRSAPATSCSSRPSGELADEELSFVRAVANTLATALARLRGEERMRHEAVHDPLTGLANRTLLRDRLEHALARSEREGGATGVLFVDLDNFKQVNDAYGHATGDAVLVETRPGVCGPRCARPTPSPGSAATSSSWCARRSTRSRRSRSAGVCRRRSSCRSPSAGSSTAVGEHRDRARAHRPRRAARRRRRGRLPGEGRRPRRVSSWPSVSDAVASAARARRGASRAAP